MASDDAPSSAGAGAGHDSHTDAVPAAGAGAEVPSSEPDAAAADASSSEPTTASQRELAQELIDEYRDREFGIQTDSLTAFVPGTQWRFREDAHSHATKIKVAEIQDALTRRNKELTAREESEQVAYHVERVKMNDDAARGILNLVLEDFDYDAVINAPGPGIDVNMLHLLAAEVASFLVVAGGRAVLQRSQMLQKQAALNRSITTRALRRNGRSSAGPTTGSAPS